MVYCDYFCDDLTGIYFEGNGAVWTEDIRAGWRIVTLADAFVIKKLLRQQNGRVGRQVGVLRHQSVRVERQLNQLESQCIDLTDCSPVYPHPYQRWARKIFWGGCNFAKICPFLRLGWVRTLPRFRPQ